MKQLVRYLIEEKQKHKKILDKLEKKGIITKKEKEEIE